MDSRHTTPLRIISFVVVLLFSWTFGGLYEIAYAAKMTKSSQKQTLKKHNRPEEKFGKAIEDIGEIVEKIGKCKTRKERASEKHNLRAKKLELETLDQEIRKQFVDTEKKLKNAGLPAKILKRHHDFVNKYSESLAELKSNLDTIEQAKTAADVAAKVEKAKEHLRKIKPPKKHKLLDPNKLPHRAAEPTKHKPRLNKEEFKDVQDAKYWMHDEVPSNRDPILVASAGPLTGLLSPNSNLNLPLPFMGESWDEGLNSELGIQSLLFAQASDLPTPEDLTETIEVKFTDAINAKAAELNNHPVKIYNWVRNNIEFVPTYGSIQGADMCLQTMKCNAFDTASLLIALFRASEIPARYVYGTIELPIERAMNWVGDFTDPDATLSFIASGGIPTRGIISGGKIVKAQIEHAWVEAFIDYFPSRGARHKTGQGETWIPLDASFKQYNYSQGIDIKSAVPFDAESFIEQIESTATINEQEGYVTGIDSLLISQTMDDYKTQVESYITENHPDATVGDVLGKKEIIKQEFPILLGTLPYKKLVTGAKYAALPDNLRHNISFSVSFNNILYDISPLSITKSLPELAGKQITLSYSPATQADENIINSYLPQPHEDGTPIDPSELPTSLPAYMINLKPELRIDGEVVATGGSVMMGLAEDFVMTFTHPTHSTDVITNKVKTGEYSGIALDLGKISDKQIQALKRQLDDTKAKIEAGNLTSITLDDALGDLLYTTALSYYIELDIVDNIISSKVRVAALRLPSESLFSSVLNVTTLMDVPLAVEAGGLVMDVDLAMYFVKSLDGDKEKPKQFMQLSGVNGSALEHSLPERLYSTSTNTVEGISAVKALNIANDQGMPIYTIDKSNVDNILTQLQIDDETISDIQNAINAGKIVTVSRSYISYNGWTGVGYILTDPNTGAGAYMISGGFAGSMLGVTLDKGCEIYSHFSDYVDCLLKRLDLVGLIKMFAAIAFAMAAKGMLQYNPWYAYTVAALFYIAVIIYLASNSYKCGKEATYCD